MKMNLEKIMYLKEMEEHKLIVKFQCTSFEFKRPFFLEKKLLKADAWLKRQNPCSFKGFAKMTICVGNDPDWRVCQVVPKLCIVVHDGTMVNSHGNLWMDPVVSSSSSPRHHHFGLRKIQGGSTWESQEGLMKKLNLDPLKFENCQIWQLLLELSFQWTLANSSVI